MITAIYTRVSTKEQETELQTSEISSFLKYKGLKDHIEYSDKGVSGKNTARPQLIRLLNDVKQGKVSTIVIWKLDRLGRNLQDLLELTKLFKQYNVNLISVKDNLDLSTLNGTMYMQLLGVFSQYERDLIMERTRAGIANAKANNVVFGRPSKLSLNNKEKMKNLRNEGKSYSAISKELNINIGSVHHYLTTEKNLNNQK